MSAPSTNIVNLDSDELPVGRVKRKATLSLKYVGYESEDSDCEIIEPKKIKKESKQVKRVKKEDLSFKDSISEDSDSELPKPKSVKKEKLAKPVKKEIKKEKSIKPVKKEVKERKTTTKSKNKIPSTSQFSHNVQWDGNELLSNRENVPYNVACAVTRLFEMGNTIPFIARYRKDLTNYMTPEKLRDVRETFEEICACKARAANIVNAIEKTGKMTPQLKQSILKCTNVHEMEHIYAPFKSQTKRTLAERAKQLDLEESALAILSESHYVDVRSLVQPNGKEGLQTLDQVNKGIMHIIAHVIATDTATLQFIRDLRSNLRTLVESKRATSEKKKIEGEDKFQTYFVFSIPVTYIKPYQVLALNRGENLKILSVKIVIPDKAYERFSSFCRYKWHGHPSNRDRQAIMESAIADAYKRLISPLIVRQTRAELNSKAEKASIEVFASNLKNLLLGTPLKGQPIMGIDPGFKIGCKVAMISSMGEVLDTSVIFPHSNKINSKKDHAIIRDLLQTHGCSLIALGNGKACRETETWLSDLIKAKYFFPLDVSYTIVDESGASIYSCSSEAKKEFQDLDPLLISAVSLARKVQDPLAEMVKVDPQHLGVGMYQHDVNKKMLETTLNEVVSECVSFVGVDLNTASQCLLRRIAGLTDLRANNIIKQRTSNGPFTNRYQLKDIKGIGDKVFEQCAGFLKVGPLNPNQAHEFYQRPEANRLDCTWIHPESYDVTEKIVSKCGLQIKDVGEPDFITSISKCFLRYSTNSLATEFNIPEATVKLILDALCKPLNRDVRKENSQKIMFKKGVTNLSDITVGMVLTGTVRNVTHFGAFVDIGVGKDGLVHSSGMAGHTIQLGDKILVRVTLFESARERIGLVILEKY